MLILLSPAKSLDFDRPPPSTETTRPALLADAQQLAGQLREFPPAQLGRLMGISDKLAAQVADQYEQWERAPTTSRAKPALFAYRGDVYAGLDADTFTTKNIEFAQNHLRILSGLYGVLRPLDLIQPYRLEMATPLKTSRGRDLYEFWGDRITRELEQALRASGGETIINLASNEYFKVIDAKALGLRVVTPTFKDKKDGKYRFLTFYGKRARGQMARYLIQRRLKRPDSLKKSYEVDGYQFNGELSSETEWVFTRDAV
jgi:uncharacterized protein